MRSLRYHMPWDGNMNWTHISSIIALCGSTAILCVSVYYNRKSIANSTKILNISEQQNMKMSYLGMISIVKKSDKGYDAFSALRIFFDSYSGVWVDDKIKKFVDDKSKEIEEFEKNLLCRNQNKPTQIKRLRKT